jgi:drug/metabolite transporter (DMT)-like permease
LVVVAVTCALLSSLAYALASVLQHRAAVAQPEHQSMRIGLLAGLVRSPLWLLGVVCDVLAYGLQFVALGQGTLVLVQPLLVSGLLFALPIGAWLAGTPMTRRDWWGAAAVVLGISMFLLAASPGDGRAEVATHDWLLLLAVTAAAVVALVLSARRRPGWRRASLLAAAAGITYGVTAALTKAVAHLLDVGLGTMVTSWQTYVLVGAGLLGMLMAQSAFQAGPIDASLPVLTVVDPVVSVMIGALVLGEGVRVGLVETSLECVALVLLTGGVVALCRAEALKGATEEPIAP